MKNWLTAGFVVVSGSVLAATVLPPEVNELGRKVSEAEAKLGVVRNQLTMAQRKYALMDTRLRRATNTLVRARQYPQGFWLMRAVVGGQPAAGDIAAMAVKQSVADVVLVDSRVKDLRATYAEANGQIDALRGLQASYSTARGRLSQSEKDALKAALLRADDLAVKLGAVKVQPEVAESLVPIPEPQAVVESMPGSAPKWPVEGKLVQAFRKAKGATAEGIVLAGEKGADVRAMEGGEVLYSGPFRQFGGLVIVKTESGADVLYGGLGSLRVNTGNHVLAGDVLGGLADDGKLYWEVRRRGRTVDPLAMR